MSDRPFDRPSAAPVNSRPLWRTAWRRWRRRPLQYILLVLGVALGVAMMVSVDLANGSAERAFQLATDTVTGRTTHRLVGGPSGLDEGVYTRLRTDAGYRPAAPVVEGYVLASSLGDQPFRLLGVDPFAEPPFRSYLGGSDGSADLSDFLIEPDTVIISADLAAAQGVVLGDSVALTVNGRQRPVRIVGVVAPTDDLSRRALSGILFSDISTAQEILGQVGRLSHIDLIVDDPAALERLAAWVPEGVRLETAASQNNAIQQMTAAFTLNLTALSLLALVVGMFLIYNTVTFSVVQRRPLFGVLRSLGVTGGQLFRLILAETAGLSLVGAALGVALGVVLGRALVGLVTQTINDFYFVVNVQSVTIPTASLIRGLLVGVVAALVAALPPAWEAMRTTPQNALRRSTLESRIRDVLPWLWPASLGLVGAGALLLWWPDAGLVVAFAGLFAVLIGLALLTPPVTAVLMDRITPMTERLFGPLGRMAPRDIVRSLSRTSVAIAALMTAVSVIVGVGIMIGSFRGTVVQWLGETLRADIYISPPGITANRVDGTLAPEAIAIAADLPGVSDIVSIRNVDVLAPELDRVIQLSAVSGDVARGERPFAWQDGDAADLWRRLEAGEGVAISEPLVIKEGLGIPPPPITLMTAAGPRTFPVLAVFYDYSSDRGSVWIDAGLYGTLWRDDGISSIALFLSEGQSADDVVAQLQTAFRGREDLLVQSNEGLRRGSLEIFDRTFAITAALQLLATIVAFIGVLSALMSLQLERARELGVLRAMGMTLRQLWALTLLETGLMGITAGVLALPTGYILAWILIYVINVRSFGWTLQMALAPATFGQALLVAVAAALLAGVYPALRLGNMVIATAVRQE